VRAGCEQVALASATTRDEQPLADWLSQDCGGLDARQQQRVAALFAADEHAVLTRGSMAALAEEDVTKILSPLPLASRHIVFSAAASLRTSHVAAQAHAKQLLSTGSRRILADVSVAARDSWDLEPSLACALDATWQDLSRRQKTGVGALFETGGLGGLKTPRYQVGPCEPYLLTKRGRV
jgi:hypothetical protein